MTAASEILSQSLTAFAFCWRLERRDGVTIGITTHDRVLDISGLTYHPAPSIAPSAILRGGDGAEEILDVRGALSSNAINEADLDAGRWDGALTLLHLTEWTEPGALWLELARGELGSVSREGGTYSVSLRSGAGAILAQPVVPITSPTCRARLGDAACRIDLRRHQRIVAIIGQVDSTVQCGALEPGVYPFGQLRWLGGANAGLAQAIVDQEGDSLFLAEAPAFAAIEGTHVLLTEGCDKRLASCVSRFANAENFRGEPHLPGMDLLTRYPGS